MRTLAMTQGCTRKANNSGAAFLKVPRKILGKLLILLLLLLQLPHSFLVLRWTELIDLLVQCSTLALYPLDDVATCVSVAPRIRSFPKIFLGTFENAAPGFYLSKRWWDGKWQWHQMGHMQIICTLLQKDKHASTSYGPDALPDFWLRYVVSVPFTLQIVQVSFLHSSGTVCSEWSAS